MLSSFLGQNASFCLRRFNCSLYDLLNGSVNYIVNSFVVNSLSENMRSSASFFLLELVMIRDNRLCFGHSDELFTHEELQCLIDYVSTN